MKVEVNKEHMDRVMKYATFKQTLILLYWSIFKPKKMAIFVDCVNRGMHLIAAWNTAKNNLTNGIEADN